MTDLTKNPDLRSREKIDDYLKNAEKQGQKLYQQNDNYRNMVNCLEHPEFRKLFDDNFKNWDDIRTITMFMKLYEKIEKSFPVELNGYQKLSILDEMIKDKHIREKVCQKALEWMKTKNQNLLESA